jgi:hypothetical protein
MSLLPDIKMDLTPLVESIPNGVERIFTLCFGKRISKQKAAQLLIETKARREARLIEEGKLDIDADGNILNFEQMQADNIQQCIEFAVQEALSRSSDKATLNDEPSQTFFNTWREYVKNIEEEDVKKLWGKLLANEVYEPNTVSLRLLNMISLVSKYEIETFISILPYIVYNRFIVTDFIQSDKKQDIFNSLYSMGLIAKIPTAFREVQKLPKYTENGFNYFNLYQRNRLIAFHDLSDATDFSLELIELTNLGKELYRITDVDNDEYIMLANSITKANLKCKTINKLSIYKLENNSVIDTLLEKNL